MVWENVEQVISWGGGKAFKEFQDRGRNLGFTQQFTEVVTLADHGSTENRVRAFGVAFHSSAQIMRRFTFPPPTESPRAIGEDLLPSFRVPQSMWDDRPIVRPRQRTASATLKLITLGFVSHTSDIGTPELPSRVYHPAGLSPTTQATQAYFNLPLKFVHQYTFLPFCALKFGAVCSCVHLSRDVGHVRHSHKGVLHRSSTGCTPVATI